MIDSVMNRMKAKRGSQLPQSKLNEKLVAKIRKTVAERERLKVVLRGMTNAAIAKQYGVHIRTIDRVTAGENWSHVD
jgi:DNA-binding CsgD family transcriptional regulator